MAINLGIFSAIFCLLLGSAFGDWNILKQNWRLGSKGLVDITLKNYCESWRLNVEIHNIRDFAVVPDECVAYIGKYMTSTQYKVDSERTVQEALVYLSTSCNLKKDGKDAWIFDVDDTLLSTVPYYKKNGFGGNKLNSTSLEEWMYLSKAPVLDHSLKLFNELKGLGVQIILVSSRDECLRSATVDNLVNEGIFGWTSLYLRGPDDASKDVQSYKADVRKQLISKGYRLWGILGDQWSSIEGSPSAKRTFKLPNPLYYTA
ncbi:OLC1v1019583C1 [Oldenlandia corymbosa var. corymbosa]|uniref:OLC1v1019583C1 n=1 Tax=Oldenlandia corymbosa var. corymbosa TaxID=529605 RepID=A0AAV1EEE4_OLDCO|nr:OLC1v1019583C1 [Oldenlandia corymbosa var. corymbosa]